jgi:uncharacterized membrane protein
VAATNVLSESSASGGGAARPGAWRLAACGAACGLGISGYLAVVGLTAAGLPVGCGAGGGCASVLTSRWAGSWGFAVGTPAAGLWLVALIASLRKNRGLLTFTALAAATAALWFVVLQLAVLRAICPWCMADHGIALTFAAIVFAGGLAEPAGPRRAIATVSALVATGLLIAGQFAVPYRPGQIGTLSAGTGEAGGVIVSGVRFGPDDSPAWGPAEAERTIVLLADYACPHCRATHGYLNELLAAEPRRFRVLVAPVPMDHDCNRTLAATEARFEHSCELAQLAIAVWKADAAAFPPFDAWLFEPETPRTPGEARAEAVRLVGAANLERALAESPLPAIVARNVDAFEAVHARRLPVILRTDGPSIEGEPADRAELDTLLAK